MPRSVRCKVAMLQALSFVGGAEKRPAAIGTQLGISHAPKGIRPAGGCLFSPVQCVSSGSHARAVVGRSTRSGFTPQIPPGLSSDHFFWQAPSSGIVVNTNG